MDFSKGVTFLSIILGIFLKIAKSEIIHNGYVNASQQISLSLNDSNPHTCSEYMFMTNYKKGYFDLVTTPSSDPRYQQKIVLSDMPHERCPTHCSSEPNYCQSISNRVFSQTQAVFSKCFPILYIYVVNQVPVSNLAGFIEENGIGEEEEILEFTPPNTLVEIVDVDQVSEKEPVFTIKPEHLETDCLTLTNVLPKGASLSHKECINPAYGTTEGALLTCKDPEGKNLFSVCTDHELEEPKMIDIGSDHALGGANYKFDKGDDPEPFTPSLTEAEVSIFLITCVFMTLLVSCVWCYNLRLIKTGEAPCAVCPICPECLFPREMEDEEDFNEDDSEL